MGCFSAATEREPEMINFCTRLGIYQVLGSGVPFLRNLILRGMSLTNRVTYGNPGSTVVENVFAALLKDSDGIIRILGFTRTGSPQPPPMAAIYLKQQSTHWEHMNHKPHT